MRPQPTAFALLTSLALAAASASAQNPAIASLSCTGAGTTLSSPVYEASVAEDFDASGSDGGSASVVLSLGSFGALVSAVSAQTAFTSCTLANGSATVTMAGVTFSTAYAAGQTNGLFGVYSPFLFDFGTAYSYLSTQPQAFAVGAFAFSTVTTSGLGVSAGDLPGALQKLRQRPLVLSQANGGTL